MSCPLLCTKNKSFHLTSDSSRQQGPPVCLDTYSIVYPDIPSLSSTCIVHCLTGYTKMASHEGKKMEEQGRTVESQVAKGKNVFAVG